LKERALVVIETGPLETVEDLLNGFIGRALEIGILDAQNECSRVPPRIKPAKKRGSQAADMQKTGWAGCKTRTRAHNECNSDMVDREV